MASIGLRGGHTNMKYTSAIAYFIVWTTTAVTVVLSSDGEPQPVVNTKYGRLLGTTLKCMSSPKPIYTFLGVPYAKPPVDDLRLALAEPVEPWEGDRDATQLGPGCPQNDEILKIFILPLSVVETPLSEDCLYLDIYSPDLNGKRDVFVFIHGGGFSMGSKQDISGTGLAAEGDIVVVTINYRLGPLGFLTRPSGKEPWPSNLGLRDQQVALRWVQENIAAFGGDPDRVTIGGESAGAMSVSAHIVSPSSEGLFHRAIVQSGSVFSVVTGATASVATYALQMLGCADEDPAASLACIRGKSIPEIIASQAQGAIVADGGDHGIPSDPVEAYKDGKIAKVDLLIGVAQNEGDQLAGFVVQELFSPEPDPEVVKQQLRQVLSDHFANNVDEVLKAVINYYFEGDIAGKDSDYIKQKLGKFVGAVMLEAPTHRAAQFHSDHVSSTYFYRFDYVASFMRDVRPAWHSPGCDHGFDQMFTTGFPNLDQLAEGMLPTDEDLAMGKMTVKYWTNFIKTGDPNGEGLAEWKPFNRQEENYLILKTECEASTFFRQDEMTFWNTKLHNLGNGSSKDRDEL